MLTVPRESTLGLGIYGSGQNHHSARDESDFQGDTAAIVGMGESLPSPGPLYQQDRPRSTLSVGM